MVNSHHQIYRDPQTPNLSLGLAEAGQTLGTDAVAGRQAAEDRGGGRTCSRRASCDFLQNPAQATDLGPTRSMPQSFRSLLGRRERKLFGEGARSNGSEACGFQGVSASGVTVKQIHSRRSDCDRGHFQLEPPTEAGAGNGEGKPRLSDDGQPRTLPFRRAGDRNTIASGWGT